MCSFVKSRPCNRAVQPVNQSTRPDAGSTWIRVGYCGLLRGTQGLPPTRRPRLITCMSADTLQAVLTLAARICMCKRVLCPCLTYTGCIAGEVQKRGRSEVHSPPPGLHKAAGRCTSFARSCHIRLAQCCSRQHNWLYPYTSCMLYSPAYACFLQQTFCWICLLPSIDHVVIGEA